MANAYDPPRKSDGPARPGPARPGPARTRLALDRMERGAGCLTDPGAAVLEAPADRLSP